MASVAPSSNESRATPEQRESGEPLWRARDVEDVPRGSTTFHGVMESTMTRKRLVTFPRAIR